MSDEISVEKLGIIPTIRDGINIGLKNIGPILINVLLWALTAWIPYLNVGTTIGLAVGVIAKASKDEAIDFLEIFDPKYRKYMGEYFLTSGLVTIGVSAGIALFIIPGIIICIAWSLAVLLVIDKGKNPTEAISLSNNLTYGYKGKMFGTYFLTGLAFSIVQIILGSIGTASHNGFLMFFFGLIIFASALLEIFVFIGIQASIYKQLAGDA